MNRRVARLAAALSLATPLALGLGALPAEAVGTGNPVITAPTNNATVANGWTGPVTINMAQAPVGSYGASVDCGTAATYNQPSWSYDGTQDTRTFSVPAVTGPDTCAVTVYKAATPGTALAQANVTVSAPAAAATAASEATTTEGTASPATFYPTVIDDYLDTTTFSFQLSAASSVTWRVISAYNGSTIRTVTAARAAGTATWVWDGKRDTGVLVQPGNFTIQATAVANIGGATQTASAATTVATGTVTKTRTLAKYGSDAQFGKTGACNIYKGSTSAEFDCWQGSGTARYSFGIPTSAYNITWGIDGERTELDFPNDGGSISKSGTRPYDDRFVVKLYVGAWRGFTVYKARVSYSYKVKI